MFATADYIEFIYVCSGSLLTTRLEVFQINAPEDKLRPVQVSVFANVDQRIVLATSFTNFFSLMICVPLY